MTPPSGRSPAAAAAAAVDDLRAVGIGDTEGRRDAALLARYILGWDEAQWISRGSEPASAGFAALFTAALARRCRREPMAYILGEREFYGRSFVVTPAVLIPRPETELVVEAALPLLHAIEVPLVVDVGTGSGCLAITIALECPAARVVATDVSPAALEIARENARCHEVLDRVEFVATSLVDDVAGPVDVMVSNPPYIPEGDLVTLAPEVVRFEPRGALFAGPDGLDVIRALLPAAARTLREGGHLLMEFGWGQSDRITRLVAGTPGLELDDIRPDLQQIPRVAVVRRSVAVR